LRDSECEAATLEAIRLGYRRIDVAASEAEADCAGAVGRGIAQALEAGLVSRQELFVVVRLPAQEYGVDVGPRALELVRALGASYVDLCLLPGPMASLQQQTLAWRALEEIHSQGLLRSLGVVDFDGYKLRELLALAEVAPLVVQNKYDVYHRGEQIDNVGDDVEGACREGRVLLMGYSPFSGLPFALMPLEDPFVRALALARGVSPATILLKWTLQRGVPVVVHSLNGVHLAANLAAAAAVVTPDCADCRLSADEMAILSGLAYLLESPFVRPT
jgi:diketogulonate reductase-like aldo/keto reductase